MPPELPQWSVVIADDEPVAASSSPPPAASRARHRDRRRVWRRRHDVGGDSPTRTRHPLSRRTDARYERLRCPSGARVRAIADRDFRDRLRRVRTGRFRSAGRRLPAQAVRRRTRATGAGARPGISLRYRDAKTTPEPDHTARSRDGCARLSGMSVRETRWTA